MSLNSPSYKIQLIGASQDYEPESYTDVSNLTGLTGYGTTALEAIALNDEPSNEGSAEIYAGGVKKGLTDFRGLFSVELVPIALDSATIVTQDSIYTWMPIVKKGNVWLWCNNYPRVFTGNDNATFPAGKALKVAYTGRTVRHDKVKGLTYVTLKLETSELI